MEIAAVHTDDAVAPSEGVEPRHYRALPHGEVVAAIRAIPASRMKAGREFSVPLGTGALEVLERARALSPDSSLVFPPRTGGVLPRNAPGRVLRRAGVARS